MAEHQRTLAIQTTTVKGSDWLASCVAGLYEAGSRLLELLDCDLNVRWQTLNKTSVRLQI